MQAWKVSCLSHFFLVFHFIQCVLGFIVQKLHFSKRSEKKNFYSWTKVDYIRIRFHVIDQRKSSAHCLRNRLSVALANRTILSSLMTVEAKQSDNDTNNHEKFFLTMMENEWWQWPKEKYKRSRKLWKLEATRDWEKVIEFDTWKRSFSESILAREESSM